MLKRDRFYTEIERVAHKTYWRSRVSRHLLALALTWLAIVLVYAISIRLVMGMAEYDVEATFPYPEDSFWAFYGIGAIVATTLLPFFIIDFLMDDVEAYRRDKGMLLEYTRQRGIDVKVRR